MSQHSMTKITVAQIDDIFNYHVTARSPYWIHGASGIGKSQENEAAARRYAEVNGWTFWNFNDGPLPAAYNVETIYGYVDLRVALMDVLDAKGAPMLDKEANLTRFLTPSILPAVTRHGRQGLLWLDELAQGVPMVTNGLSSLVLDGNVGDSYVFPDGWSIGAAGNRKEDHAATSKVGAQMYNRFAHYEAKEDIEGWIEFQLSNGADPRLGNFMRMRGGGDDGLFHRYIKGDIVFPTPRSWTKVAQVIDTVEDRDLREILIGGLVGNGPAIEVNAFLDVATQVVTYADVVSDPLITKVPEVGTEGAICAMFAILSMVTRSTVKSDMDAVMTYIRRFPVEHQAYFVSDLKVAKPEVIETEALNRWRADHPDVAS